MQYFVVIVLALTINFGLPRLAPGDPLAFVIGQELYEEMTPEERQSVRKELDLDALRQDYMMLAEAKGASKRRLMFRHAMRNALLLVYTHVTMSLSMLFSGAVIVETVFSYPDIGSLLYESVMARDFALMQGVFLMSTIAVILANMLADLTYPLVDPGPDRRNGPATGRDGADIRCRPQACWRTAL